MIGAFMAAVRSMSRVTICRAPHRIEGHGRAVQSRPDDMADLNYQVSSMQPMNAYRNVSMSLLGQIFSCSFTPERLNQNGACLLMRRPPCAVNAEQTIK